MRTCPHQPVHQAPQLVVLTDAMSELEYMAYILAQLRTGQRQPLVKFSSAELEAMKEEHIGEHFLQYPFLY